MVNPGFTEPGPESEICGNKDTKVFRNRKKIRCINMEKRGGPFLTVRPAGVCFNFFSAII